MGARLTENLRNAAKGNKIAVRQSVGGPDRAVEDMQREDWPSAEGDFLAS